MADVMMTSWADASTGRLKLFNEGVTSGSFQTLTEETLQAVPQTLQGYSRLESSSNCHWDGPANPSYPQGAPAQWLCSTNHPQHSDEPHHGLRTLALGAPGLETFSEASVVQDLSLLPLSASRVPLPLTFYLLFLSLNMSYSWALGCRKLEIKYASRLSSLENSPSLDE